MGFNNIDAPGRAYDRRGVRTIQKVHGKAERLAAAEARRARKKAKRARPTAILFYAEPERGFVAAEDRDGAYIMQRRGNQQQIVVAGELRAAVEHYVKALGLFLKAETRLVSTEDLWRPEGVTRSFTSIIVEVGDPSA